MSRREPLKERRTPLQPVLLKPHHIRQIRAKAEKATPGPYHLTTDSCDCDPGCSHGSWPYKLEAEGVYIERYPHGFPGRFERVELADFSEGNGATMEDGEFLAAVDPATIIALCDHALHGFEVAHENSMKDSWGLFRDAKSILEAVSTDDLVKELAERLGRVRFR